ncbi:ATP-binding protein [Kribbella speibonae]|uniref:ATP-binding protein n=1 Tax=Kribbella speibonae TaxID=1572660 RepID=UPI0013F44087|nr:ATP-binding protein [Kribbella speibonae]
MDGDARQLDRLVRNLIDNAMRHVRTAVTVRIEEQAGYVVLQVDDDRSNGSCDACVGG